MGETPHNSKIQIVNVSSGETTEHNAEFADSEWICLQDYVEYVADLQSTRFVQNGGKVQVNFNWTYGVNPQGTALSPPPDDVLAFLHRLRPFILQNEATHFSKIRSIVSRRFGDRRIRLLMNWLLEQYEGKHLQGMIEMDSNGVRMNCEKMLLAWLNSHEYHRDHEKRELIKTHTKILPPEWWRGVFLLLLNEKAKAIFDLGIVVETVLGKRGSFSTSI
jgi:hypothetical protein